MINPNWIRPAVRAIKAYRLEAHLEAIKLNQNESPWDIPAPLKEKALEKLGKISWNRYPFFAPFGLLEKLSKKLGWDSNGILITNGSNVLIQAILLATAIESCVLTIEPTFSLYELEAQMLGNRVVKVPLNRDFSLPLDDFLAAIVKHRPSVIFLANPNAPTGNLFPKNFLQQILEKAECPVVIDEAYTQFADESMLDTLKHFENLLILRTFSKAWNAGALRLGFVLGDKNLIQEIGKVTLPYCVNPLTEAIAEVLIEEETWIAERVLKIKQERERVYRAMQGIRKIEVFSSQTNFLMFRVEDSQKVFEGLLKQGVLIRNVSHPPSFDHLLRVSIGTHEENDRFLMAFTAVV